MKGRERERVREREREREVIKFILARAVNIGVFHKNVSQFISEE